MSKSVRVVLRDSCQEFDDSVIEVTIEEWERLIAPAKPRHDGSYASSDLHRETFHELINRGRIDVRLSELRSIERCLLLV